MQPNSSLSQVRGSLREVSFLRLGKSNSKRNGIFSFSPVAPQFTSRFLPLSLNHYKLIIVTICTLPFHGQEWAQFSGFCWKRSSSWDKPGEKPGTHAGLPVRWDRTVYSCSAVVPGPLTGPDLPTSMPLLKRIPSRGSLRLLPYLGTSPPPFQSHLRHLVPTSVSDISVLSLGC